MPVLRNAAVVRRTAAMLHFRAVRQAAETVALHDEVVRTGAGVVAVRVEQAEVRTASVVLGARVVEWRLLERMVNVNVVRSM